MGNLGRRQIPNRASVVMKATLMDSEENKSVESKVKK